MQLQKSKNRSHALICIAFLISTACASETSEEIEKSSALEKTKDKEETSYSADISISLKSSSSKLRDVEFKNDNEEVVAVMTVTNVERIGGRVVVRGSVTQSGRYVIDYKVRKRIKGISSNVVEYIKRQDIKQGNFSIEFSDSSEYSGKIPPYDRIESQVRKMTRVHFIPED